MRGSTIPVETEFRLDWRRSRASQVALVVKNPPADAGNIRHSGLIPGLERSPGVGNGNSLQYSCLENPHGQRSWQAIVHGVTKSCTQLSNHIDISSNVRTIAKAASPSWNPFHPLPFV